VAILPMLLVCGAQIARAQESTPTAQDGARPGALAKGGEGTGGDWSKLPPDYRTTVRARRLPPEPSLDPASAATVLGREHFAHDLSSLASVLDREPGLKVSSAGGLGGFSTLSVRGSSADQVQVYLDGIRLNPCDGGPFDLSTLSVGNIERIEVYRGPAPLALGGGGLGGVLSITTRVPRRTGLHVETGGGSFGTRAASGFLSWAQGAPERPEGGASDIGRRAPSIALGATYVGSEGNFGYVSDNGTAMNPTDDRQLERANNASDALDTLLKARISLGNRAELVVLNLLYLRKGGLPGLGIRPTASPWTSLTREVAQVALKAWDLARDGDRLHVQTYLGHIASRFEDPRGEFGWPRDSRYATTVPGASALWQVPLLEQLELGLRAEARHEAFSPESRTVPQPTTPAATRETVNASAELAWRIPALALVVLPSVRIERARTTAVTNIGFPFTYRPLPTVEATEPSLRLGLVARPWRPLALKANVSRSSRLPSFFELFGDTGPVRGAPDLRPERGTIFDAGLTLSHGFHDDRDVVTLEAFVFRSVMEDLIGLVQLAQGVATHKNVGRARLQGLELGGSTDLLGHVRVRAGYTLLDSLNRSGEPAYGGKVLPYRPRTRWGARAELYGRPVRVLDEVALFVDAAWQAGNFVDEANLSAIPARTLVGAGAHAFLPGRRWKLVVTARNLTDAHVSDLVGYPLPGRSIDASVGWQAF